jgi:hypothetical protein
MTELQNKDWSLLAKYACQETTRDEQKEAEQLLAERESIKKAVDAFMQLRSQGWQMEVDEQEAFERLTRRIKSEKLI